MQPRLSDERRQQLAIAFVTVARLSSAVVLGTAMAVYIGREAILFAAAAVVVLAVVESHEPSAAGVVADRGRLAGVLDCAPPGAAHEPGRVA